MYCTVCQLNIAVTWFPTCKINILEDIKNSLYNGIFVNDSMEGDTQVCDDCGEQVSKKAFKRHKLRRHDTRSFQCDECPEQVIGKEKFDSHKVCDLNLLLVLFVVSFKKRSIAK